MPPHPTPPQPNLRICVFQKRAFYEHGFRSAGQNIHLHMVPISAGKKKCIFGGNSQA